MNVSYTYSPQTQKCHKTQTAFSRYFPIKLEIRSLVGAVSCLLWVKAVFLHPVRVLVHSFP